MQYTRTQDKSLYGDCSVNTDYKAGSKTEGGVMTTDQPTCKDKPYAFFVGYLPNVDGDFDYDRARCLSHKAKQASCIKKRRGY